MNFKFRFWIFKLHMSSLMSKILLSRKIIIKAKAKISQLKELLNKRIIK